MTPLATAFEDLLGALDRLEIKFLIGGSVASGTHGLPRQTNDIDIVADVRPGLVAEFCAVLGQSFYVARESVELALATGRAFNVIHLKSAYKFDIFPAGDNPFIHSELSRRRYATTAVTGLEHIEFPVASPEDTILAKLLWFRRGGESSDRQWHDILGVLRIQAGRLEESYLLEWAEGLGISDLLARALSS